MSVPGQLHSRDVPALQPTTICSSGFWTDVTAPALWTSHFRFNFIISLLLVLHSY